MTKLFTVQEIMEKEKEEGKSMERIFKVLNVDGTPFHGGRHGAWALPHNGQSGEWMPPIEGKLTRWNGYHLCREGDLLEWLGPAIFLAEYRGDRVDCDDDDLIVVREARLLRRLPWDNRIARLFACDCAGRVLSLCGHDPRPGQTIEVARRFAYGQASKEELAAAFDEAWEENLTLPFLAAREAARAAAWEAAIEASQAAVWATERAAAQGCVTWESGCAAWEAAREAERGWQIGRLMACFSS